MRGLEVAGEPLLIARRRDGGAFALRDICPHRGAPLSAGRFDGETVECPYHGWRFDRTGTCRAIPALIEGAGPDPSRISVARHPCRTAQGAVWVFLGPGEPGEPPLLPDIGAGKPIHVETMEFRCHVDHAVIGLMDPAHGPFVHASWWWRSRRSIHEKAKAFAPSELGFTMLRHAPSSNSAAYRILGGKVSTEISFRLPGIRIEHVRGGRHAVVGLTAVTPIDATRTRVQHAVYATMGWAGLARPLIGLFARNFLGQDRRIVETQQRGLRHDPTLMLVGDADMQARWYYRLRNEWLASRAEGRPFANPVRERTLKWRS